MRSMRVAVISHGYPPYYARAGGVATYTYNLTHALARKGIDVTVYTGGPVPNVERQRNLTIHRLPHLMGSHVPPNFLWFQLRHLKLLLSELAQFDIIHSQGTQGSISALAKQKSKTKWVVTFHASQIREVSSMMSTSIGQWSATDVLTNLIGTPIWEFLYRVDTKYADHYFGVGSLIRDYMNLYNIDNSKLTVIRNGIDLKEMQELSGNAESGSEPNTIIFFGRLYVRKGVDLLVKAMKSVIKRKNDAKLKIFGDGPQKPRLRSLIDELDLSRNVTLEGFVSREEVVSEMKRCAAVVYPTLYEAQSTSVLEAMACHTPVIGFNVPTMKEIVSHMRTGYLVEPMDPEKLGDGICALLNDEGLRRRLGDAAYDYVRENHDWANLVEKYIETYDSVLQ